MATRIDIIWRFHLMFLSAKSVASCVNRRQSRDYIVFHVIKRWQEVLSWHRKWYSFFINVIPQKTSPILQIFWQELEIVLLILFWVNQNFDLFLISRSKPQNKIFQLSVETGQWKRIKRSWKNCIYRKNQGLLSFWKECCCQFKKKGPDFWWKWKARSCFNIPVWTRSFWV